ncbi:MAG: hypothetical protein VKI81_10430 [Synechococcaceae cyanobacterium]|nr:hypothetical protein [Synechococcaceae cyanobacterium]
MSTSIDRPHPDGQGRRDEALRRRRAMNLGAERRGDGTTLPNGEETRYDLSFALNYHKGLPHDLSGTVDPASYRAMVSATCRSDPAAMEALPVGGNRTGSGTAGDPARVTTGGPDAWRQLISPLTGHAYELEGGDAAAFGIGAAPALDSDELAAEMAELYVMALLRDVSFTQIEAGTNATVTNLRTALGGMPWFNGSYLPATAAEARRLATRGILTSDRDLFRGSTPGSKAGPWVSQFLLVGSDSTGKDIRLPIPPFPPPDLGIPAPGPVGPSQFRGLRASFRHEDGFVAFGTQPIDQRHLVALEGVDYMTDWASWLDAQNGVEFSGLDSFHFVRRFLTTPRDIATYVHFDQLYQAYLVACLLMLSDGRRFPFDRGMPESTSRTRMPFASFGGPHVLSLVTEVATRALKAVWRQKWLHHRRARPEVVAALLTLHEHDATLLPSAELVPALNNLRAKIPAAILTAVASHNAGQNALIGRKVTPTAPPPGFPAIAPAANFLLPMAFPEGSPTHPAYGAGHATVAGACVTVLKAFFEMFDAATGAARTWPYPVYTADPVALPRGRRLSAVALAPGSTPLTIQGELDKLAMNISNARNMAGVHYYTDYYESIRLGERIAVSILEEHLSMYTEPVLLQFDSFDGERIVISSNGDDARIGVGTASGTTTSEAWFSRYGA